MVSCGKRGSLPAAGPETTAAASHPPAAASVTDESKTGVNAWFLLLFDCGESLVEGADRNQCLGTV